MEYKKYIWQAQFEKKTNWLKAVTTLKQATDLFPEEYELYFELGQLFYERKLFPEAIEYFQKAIEIFPSYTNIYFKIANCYLALKEENLAIYYYDKIKDNYPEALYNKAVALLGKNKTGEVIQTLEELLLLNPDTETPYFFLSEQYLMNRQYEKALKTLSSAEALFGSQGRVNFFKGISYSAQKQWIKAYYEFQKCEKMKFNGQGFYRAYAVASEKIGKFEQSINLFKHAIEETPTNLPLYLDLINTYISRNMIKEAYKTVLQAKKIKPYSSPVSLIYNKLKKMLEEKKEYPEK
ncbi:MAG: hypothetical protein CSB55_08940 [Candidatus Cloacimonadota bacterium]|nr:MAG: hypothetical protein CSB55_08940 [Candidatus Cloacimonadota bacterium]